MAEYCIVITISYFSSASKSIWEEMQHQASVIQIRELVLVTWEEEEEEEEIHTVTILVITWEANSSMVGHPLLAWEVHWEVDGHFFKINM